jgi:hypothetical protein
MPTGRERTHPETLPLFGEDGETARRRQGARAFAPRRRQVTLSQRHLYAARRLAKGMWRLPEGSAEQTRAGQEICRHLIASLED